MPRTPPLSKFTRAIVELHGPDDMIAFSDGSAPDIGSVVSVETHKEFGSASGSFTLSLKRQIGQQYRITDVFDDADDIWVHIVFIVNGRAYDSFWGLTDAIHSSVTRSGNGQRTESITIIGRDIGKCFDSTTLFFNMYARADEGTLPNLASYNPLEALGGEFTPDEFIRKTVRAWLGNNGLGDKQWLMPGSIFGDTAERHFFDWLTLNTVSPGLRGLTSAPTMINADISRNLWDTLQQYSNGMLNELWVDLVRDPQSPEGSYSKMIPALFMRERPFPTIKSSDRWDALPEKRLKPADVKQSHLVKDGSQRYNYWQLTAKGLGATEFSIDKSIQDQSGRPAGQPGNVPIFSLDSIRRHGLRKFSQDTIYLPVNERSSGSSASETPWLRTAVQWLRMLHDWYVIAPWQQTGSIVTSYLRPDIRIGDKLIEERGDGEEWEYYVEGIGQKYTYPASGETSLTVTRGNRRRESRILVQIAYQQYIGVDTTSMTDQQIIDTSPAAADAAGIPPNPYADPESETPLPNPYTTPDGTLASNPTTAAANEDALADTPDANPYREVSKPSDAEDADVTDADFTQADQPEHHVLTLDPTVITAPVTPTRPLRRRSRLRIGPIHLRGRGRS